MFTSDQGSILLARGVSMSARKEATVTPVNTRQRRRPTSALEYDVYRVACPTRRVLDRIADKWTTLIVGVLSERPYLFGELRTAIEGISNKVLTENLRALETDGLVRREVLPTRRVTVEYSLTPLGATLTTPLGAIRDWAAQHIEEIQEANEQSRARKAERVPSESSSVWLGGVNPTHRYR